MTFWPSRSATGMMIWAVVGAFSLFPDELLIGLDARLGLRLTGFRRGGDPLAFLGERPLARGVLAAFLFEALLLLLQPRRIIALVGDAAAAVELEDPPVTLSRK